MDQNSFNSLRNLSSSSIVVRARSGPIALHGQGNDAAACDKVCRQPGVQAGMPVDFPCSEAEQLPVRLELFVTHTVLSLASSGPSLPCSLQSDFFSACLPKLDSPFHRLEFFKTPSVHVEMERTMLFFVEIRK
ncbi:hypothetical protein ACWGPW_08675 [Paenibacillus chitinolyticus]